MIWIAIISLFVLSALFFAKGRRVSKLLRDDDDSFSETVVWVVDRVSRLLGMSCALLAIFLIYIALSSN